jgi:hypothetical protein
MRLKQVILVIGIALLVVLGCNENSETEGRVVRIDYQGAELKEGEWVQIDSFRFEHIGSREEAADVRYPLPSSEVFVDSMRGREFSRDYNSKVVAIYIAKHLEKINERLPEGERYNIPSHSLLTYRGVLELVKEDSSKIRVQKSDRYDPKIEVVR